MKALISSKLEEKQKKFVQIYGQDLLNELYNELLSKRLLENQNEEPNKTLTHEIQLQPSSMFNNPNEGSEGKKSKESFYDHSKVLASSKKKLFSKLNQSKF